MFLGTISALLETGFGGMQAETLRSIKTGDVRI